MRAWGCLVRRMNTLGLTFESLRGDDDRRRRGDHQRVASADATGVILVPSAGWTGAGVGGGEAGDSSNALVLSDKQVKQIHKDHDGPTPEEDEREGQTLWGYCCCCCWRWRCSSPFRAPLPRGTSRATRSVRCAPRPWRRRSRPTRRSRRTRPRRRPAPALAARASAFAVDASPHAAAAAQPPPLAGAPQPRPPPAPPLQPGQIYTVTLAFALIETHYGGSVHTDDGPGHPRSRAPPRPQRGRGRRAILRTALRGLDLSGFFLSHVRLSNTLTRWTCTVVIRERDKPKWEAIINDPVFIPHINHEWDQAGNSLFDMLPRSQRVVVGRRAITAPPNPPSPPASPPRRPARRPTRRRRRCRRRRRPRPRRCRPHRRTRRRRRPRPRRPRQRGRRLPPRRSSAPAAAAAAAAAVAAAADAAAADTAAARAAAARAAALAPPRP